MVVPQNVNVVSSALLLTIQSQTFNFWVTGFGLLNQIGALIYYHVVDDMGMSPKLNAIKCLRWYGDGMEQ